ncbi:MAG: hypothetical protein F4W96_11630 [Chloroflexi bacterium]|nr:hypothetical protein [Chloroflexota bacterium]
MSTYDPRHPGESILLPWLEPLDISISNAAGQPEIDHEHLGALYNVRGAFRTDRTIRPDALEVGLNPSQADRVRHPNTGWSARSLTTSPKRAKTACDIEQIERRDVDCPVFGGDESFAA